MSSLSFTLQPIAPFRLDLTAWALRRRASNTIDRWDAGAYRRAILVGDRAVEVSAFQKGTAARPALEVTVRGASLPRETREVVTAALDRALGLRVDLGGFYRMAKKDARLERLAARFRGLKPPRFPSVFEAVVNGIACQQLSLAVGILLLGRLTLLCGLPAGAGSALRAFPRATDVAGLRPSDLRELGFSFGKAHALLDLARRVQAGLDLEALADLDDDAAVNELVALRGVGRWTAEYVLLRGFGRLTSFPGDDVGARANLSRWMKLRRPLDYDGVRRLARRWQPYAGLLYFHLLLARLEEAGLLAADPAYSTLERSATRPDARPPGDRPFPLPP